MGVMQREWVWERRECNSCIVLGGLALSLLLLISLGILFIVIFVVITFSLFVFFLIFFYLFKFFDGFVVMLEANNVVGSLRFVMLAPSLLGWNYLNKLYNFIYTISIYFKKITNVHLSEIATFKKTQASFPRNNL